MLVMPNRGALAAQLKAKNNAAYGLVLFNVTSCLSICHGANWKQSNKANEYNNNA